MPKPTRNSGAVKAWLSQKDPEADYYRALRKAASRGELRGWPHDPDWPLEKATKRLQAAEKKVDKWYIQRFGKSSEKYKSWQKRKDKAWDSNWKKSQSVRKNQKQGNVKNDASSGGR